MSMSELTRERIETLSGVELDIAVAELVMGWTFSPSKTNSGYNWRKGGVSAKTAPRYSAGLEQAMQVVERLREEFSNLALYADNGWGCHVWDVLENGEHVMGPSAHGDTLQVAVCRTAALWAAGAKP
jgi:hypothetical protein